MSPPSRRRPRDLRVAVNAISVNPVDAKVRLHARRPRASPRVLGYDAAGIVEAIGSDVTLFRAGDEVFYAGVDRPGRAPMRNCTSSTSASSGATQTLSFAQAAALPLTTITAWEMLFDRLPWSRARAPTRALLVIINGAGGVGSILTQMARRLTGLTVSQPLSRPESRDWCLKLGAHHVIDHSKPLADQLKAHRSCQRGAGREPDRHRAALCGPTRHCRAARQDRIDRRSQELRYQSVQEQERLGALGVDVHPCGVRHAGHDRATPLAQRRVGDLIDKGVLRTTLDQSFGTINAANLKRAHALLKSGKSRGKIVLEGW